MKKVKVYIERSEDGCFYAYAANPMILPYGLTGEGDSVEQAKTDVAKCLRGYASAL